ncbi:MAG: family 2 glycosyl transferase [Rariglobus sp.]|jgi:glycosyltransferase involved in cell wall biosynthesis|nr:family 2 glycosyl transferase [Rariglobus sp.]
MKKTGISVIICTHNPRADYLDRTLSALRAQTLAVSEWELLIVDNASTLPVNAALTTWHPAARVVREEELGLTAARRRAIATAISDTLLFVDDDNVLAADYLEQASRISRDWPMLGVWGCGEFIPEWETPPPADFKPYLAYLAVGRRERDAWSNHPFDYQTMPAGAGLCVRAPVAQRYREQVTSDPRRLRLGRKGGSLGACEDFDLGLTAIALGFGTGVFTSLRLTHLMPASRVQESYLLRLAEGHASSTVFLHHLHGRTTHRRTGWMARLRHWRYRRHLDAVGRRLDDALQRGESSALAELSNQ